MNNTLTLKHGGKRWNSMFSLLGNMAHVTLHAASPHLHSAGAAVLTLAINRLAIPENNYAQFNVTLK